MPKFQLNIGQVLSTGAMGPNFNISVDAPDFIAALDAVKGPLTLVLKETALGLPQFDAPGPPPGLPVKPE